MTAVRPCTTASFTLRGWNPILAAAASAYWQTGDRELLNRLLAMLRA